MWTYQTIPLLRMLQATTDPSIHLKIGGGVKIGPQIFLLEILFCQPSNPDTTSFIFGAILKIKKPETDEEEKRRI